MGLLCVMPVWWQLISFLTSLLYHAQDIAMCLFPNKVSKVPFCEGGGGLLTLACCLLPIPLVSLWCRCWAALLSGSYDVLVATPAELLQGLVHASIQVGGAEWC